MIKALLKDFYDVVKARKEFHLDYLKQVAQANKKMLALDQTEVAPYRSTRIGFGSTL